MRTLSLLGAVVASMVLFSCGSTSPGTACSTNADCSSGQVCSGGKCADTSARTDGGASTSCTPNMPCRPAAGPCDVMEICGLDGVCPPDLLLNGTVCRASAGSCDVEEKCNGTSPTCPTDAFAAANTPCATASCSAGKATAAGYCSGYTTECGTGLEVACNGYQCRGDTCGTSCSSDTDCLSTHYCQTGQCAPKRADGTACTGPNNGFECVSGTCLGSYVDADGDGVGTGSLGYFCGTAAPSGRSTAAGDCCDSDANAKPGQTAFFGTARNGCGGFDYNCDNSETREDTSSNACNSIGACADGDRDCDGTEGWSASAPGCGQSSTYVTSCGSIAACNPSTCFNCHICDATTETRTQGCR